VVSVGRLAPVRSTAEVVRTIGDPPVLASPIAVEMSAGVVALMVWAQAPEAKARTPAAPAVVSSRRRAVRNLELAILSPNARWPRDGLARRRGQETLSGTILHPLYR